MTEFKIIAKTFQGLEEVLAKELINLGANNVEIGRRMVAFTGDKEMLREEHVLGGLGHLQRELPTLEVCGIPCEGCHCRLLA